MKKSRLGLLSASISVFAISSCAYLFPDQYGSEKPLAEEPVEEAFIDPAILAQSQCGAPPPTAKSIAEKAIAKTPVFEFAAPFALPDDIIKNFHYPISSEDEEAQRWFDIGMTHMVNFNHDEAIASFREAQKHDPDCAMCYWGEGLSFGSNINAPYNSSRGAAGLSAAQKATELSNSASEHEIALINALATRYYDGGEGEVLEAAEAYAIAMDKVTLSYPDDKFILSLAAEANLDTQPWNYWEVDGREPRGRTARTIEILEQALEIDPEFAPSIHLYIHATEASVDPFRAESYADRLAAQSLGVGHLVHMPSHIYLRLGDWKKSHKANVEAIAADEAYISQSENATSYSYTYYPHNVHFLVANAQMGGDGETALQMAEKLKKVAQLDPSSMNPFGEHVAAAPVLTEIQFGSHENILDMPAPPEAHLYVRAAWRYARGLTFARQGQISEAKIELSALSALENHSGLEEYEPYGVPLPGIVKVAKLTLEGHIAGAEENLTQAIKLLDAAADAQDQLSYMEPAWWYNHTRQTLGAYLIKDGQNERAEREFYRTLLNTPNNAYALFGLAEAYKAQGDEASEKYARHLFNKAWIGEEGQSPNLSDL